VVSSELLLDRMCGFDQVVERRVYPGQSHAGAVGASFDDMLAWMADRFAGRPAPSDCDAGGSPSTTTVPPSTSSTTSTSTTTPPEPEPVSVLGMIVSSAPAVPIAAEPRFTG